MHLGIIRTRDHAYTVCWKGKEHHAKADSGSSGAHGSHDHFGEFSVGTDWIARDGRRRRIWWWRSQWNGGVANAATKTQSASQLQSHSQPGAANGSGSE